MPTERVARTVPVAALFAPDAPDAPPLQIPVTATIPVELLLMPWLVATTVPPVTLPVAFKVPVEILFAPKALSALPPVTLPVMFKVPFEEFLAATPKFPIPPVQFPVIVSVPELFNEAAAVAFVEAWLVAEPVKFPTINPDAGEAAVN